MHSHLLFLLQLVLLFVVVGGGSSIPYGGAHIVELFRTISGFCSILNIFAPRDLPGNGERWRRTFHGDTIIDILEIWWITKSLPARFGEINSMP